MGGERSGQDASRIAINEVFNRFSAGFSPELDTISVRQLMTASISAANSIVYTTARMNYRSFGMGTTCVAAFVTADTAFVANVGDSRAYLITDTGLYSITTDHNVASLLYEQGKITEEEMAVHPQKHMLTRAVGVEKTVLTDTFTLTYEDKINLLLCSDGLSGYCSDDEIYDVLSQTDFDTAAEALIQLALNKGGRDNVTVAIIGD
jgi:protein phosphatase